MQLEQVMGLEPEMVRALVVELEKGLALVKALEKALLKELAKAKVEKVPELEKLMIKPAPEKTMRSWVARPMVARSMPRHARHSLHSRR